jgi:hypothetical protein
MYPFVPRRVAVLGRGRELVTPGRLLFARQQPPAGDGPECFTCSPVFPCVCSFGSWFMATLPRHTDSDRNQTLRCAPSNAKAQQRRPAGHDAWDSDKRAAVCCSRLFGLGVPWSEYRPRPRRRGPSCRSTRKRFLTPLLGMDAPDRMCRGRYAVLFVVGVRLAEVGELAPRSLAVGSDAVTQRLVGRESQHHAHWSVNHHRLNVGMAQNVQHRAVTPRLPDARQTGKNRGRGAYRHLLDFFFRDIVAL